MIIGSKMDILIEWLVGPLGDTEVSYYAMNMRSMDTVEGPAAVESYGERLRAECPSTMADWKDEESGCMGGLHV